MDFVPTLCALGTIGIGPAGLALGYEEQDTIPRPTSRKRKAPRSGVPSRPFSTPLMRTADYSTPNTTQSEPLKLEPNHDQPRASTSHGTGLKPAFWRRMSVSSSPFQNSTPSISRQSSVGARRSLMSRADHDASPSAENNDLENLKRSSSWLKRISTISSLNGSPSSSVRPTTPSISFSNNSATPFLASGGLSTLPPNKLVKRTSSHRAISANHAKAPQLRRPATSHQRSATFGNMTTEELSRHGPPEPNLSLSEHYGSSSTPPVWRPYFSSGYGRLNASQPRKRHTSGSGRADSIRPVQKISNRHPILVSAKSVESRPSQDDIDDVDVRNMSNSYMVDIDEQHNADDSKVATSHIPKKKHRSRHSFSVSDMFGSSSPTVSKTSAAKSKSGSVQRRRGMTEPPPGKSDTTRLDRTNASPLSPISNVSTFDIDLPRGTPTFPLHPNFDTRSESSSVPRFPSSSNAMLSNRNKRVSLAPSDPASTTFGSDYDQRVFSSGDEDSVDFQSDTAYDSLATRATASSHSGLRGPGIETIFDESPPRETSKNLVALEDLMGGGMLGGLAINMERNHKGPMARSIVQEQLFDSSSPRQPSSVSREDGYEPDEEETEDSMEELHHVSTPVRTQTFEEDDFIATPMPKRRELAQVDVCSPASSVQCNSQVQGKEDIRMSIEAMSIDESEWDKTTDPESTLNESMKLPDFPRHISRRITPPPFRIHQDSADGMDVDSMDWHAEQRLSIFNWSEQQKSDRDLLNGSSPRPRTMHGKQSLENRGSRSSGRRGLSALHLRSQSVPVARESMMENDPHFPATKFGTWGLGNKGVSEEWNDDFEFDDIDNGDDKELGGLPLNTIPSQGMRVPQSIIDRQASVHGQFGQVQEFMLLVEELKRLRIHGAALDLLEGPSGHIWDDAENIINLATLNDDDDDLRPPNSPASPSAFDDFDEQSPPLSRARKQSDIHSDDNGYLEPVPRRSISSAATPPSGRPRGDSLAQVKSFLQTIQQSRNGPDSSPAEIEIYQQKKLPFDTRDLRELVSRASTVTRALKEIVRKAEGVSVSPDKTPKKVSDPAFSQIFHRVEESPSPSPSSSSSLRKPSLPKSRSAHGYLGSSMNGGSTTQNDRSGRMKMMTVV